MVFPWADGNLKDYWQKFDPAGLPPLQSCDLARWMSRQCLGLARGLQKIHYSGANSSKTQSPGVGGETPMKRYGRHGDLKPENILWFQNDGSAYSVCTRGILKISDFGFSDFHGSGSKSRFALEGITPTYRSPEGDARDHVSKEDDIWSLGCVLLEFVVWSLLGWNGVDKFSQERTNDSTTSIYVVTDDFFNFIERSAGERKAQSKRSVQQVSYQIDPRHFEKLVLIIIDRSS
jgi:serine/threonine protein kinase